MQNSRYDTHLLDQILYVLDSNGQCNDNSVESEDEREKRLNEYFKGVKYSADAPEGQK